MPQQVLLLFPAGNKHIFSCSGTIVEFRRGTGSVVTSASLVKWPHEDKQADELKVAAFLCFLYGIII